MHSQRKFTPGSRTSTSRIINYVAAYNALYPNQSEQINCYCIPEKYDKNTPGSQAASAKVSYATRIAQVIQSKKGGNVQYGNFYLGQPLNVNYLGKTEGMPGGSGMPPVNRF